jgi:hypothetical protein
MYRKHTTRRKHHDINTHRHRIIVKQPAPNASCANMCCSPHTLIRFVCCFVGVATHPTSTIQHICMIDRTSHSHKKPIYLTRLFCLDCSPFLSHVTFCFIKTTMFTFNITTWWHNEQYTLKGGEGIRRGEEKKAMMRNHHRESSTKQP